VNTPTETSAPVPVALPYPESLTLVQSAYSLGRYLATCQNCLYSGTLSNPTPACGGTGVNFQTLTGITTYNSSTIPSNYQWYFLPAPVTSGFAVNIINTSGQLLSACQTGNATCPAFTAPTTAAVQNSLCPNGTASSPLAQWIPYFLTNGAYAFQNIANGEFLTICESCLAAPVTASSAQIYATTLTALTPPSQFYITPIGVIST
jgi:hypothetical protein